ncbi:hypothetical protein CBR_g32116 [Chara braunii]|uniref:HAT C-terminal dimerisation domain-containing protein n=1 Tax=Chara braunii TaxID=69332 RepID=A0A388LGK7_CHABU|nr:hypothetical protein CBR_g32116 [Chara braunii]|eukprot:GBG81439.1 hypothetical protein CBR_g32116 [Chara braunii]
MTGGAGSSGAGGSGGAQFDPLFEKEMSKLRRGNIVWNYVTAGQYVGDQSKMHADRKLRCNLCGHLFQGGSSKAARHFTQSKFCKAGGMRVLAELWDGMDYTFVSSTAQRVQRWMADEGIRDTRAPAGGQSQRMDDLERDDMQDALDEEGREGGAREGAVADEADEADEAVGEPNLPGEEVVMTSRGVGGAGPATRAPRGEVERARREKRIVGQDGVEVPDTGREKRARQTTIVEMYAREKLAEFHDAWLQWIYVKKLPFNAFRGPEFQRVRQAAERVPRSIQFRFPSFKVTAGAGIPSQRAKVATMVSKHLLQLMRRVDVPTDMIEPWVPEVAIRNLHMLEPAHAAAHLLNPRRRSLTYYHSLQTTADNRLVVEECDRFLLAQTDGDSVGRLYRTVRDQMRAFHSRRGDWGDRELSDADAADCTGDSETERCAVWWFEHGRAHPELRTIAICVMHLWTSASPAERNWAEHERVSTARRCKLGFAKLAQLVEIATNLKLASCARQGGGYVLPWVMGSGRGGTTAEEEEEEGDEIQRQIVAFRDNRPSRARSVRDMFGSRATELRPWPKGGDDVDVAAADDDIDDDWTDDDDTPLSRDPTAERVHFTYSGGRDSTDSFTSVITGAVSSTAPTSSSSRVGGGHGGRSHAEVRVDDSGEQQPRGGLRQTGRRWEVRSDSEEEGEAEDEEVALRDRRFSPSHHPISAQPEGEPLRRSERLASAAGRDRTHDGEDRGGERTPSDAGIRPRSPSVLHTQDFEDIGLGGSLADLSVEGRRRASPQDVHTDADVERGPVETEEERDARLVCEEEERLRSLPQWEGRFAYLDEQRRQRDLETGGEGSRDVDNSGIPEEAVQGEFDYEGQDAAAGVPEGQDVVMDGGSPSGGHGNSETAGDEGQGAAVCGRGEGGPGGDGDTAGVGGDDGPDGNDDDDHGPEDDPRKSGKQRAPGRVYSPPPFTVQSPHWSGSSLSSVRGRESGAGQVGSGRRSDGGRDSAGSMPPPPTRTPEGRVDTGDRTVAPAVAHSGGSPPPIRGGVGGGWSAVRRVRDRLRAPGGASSRDVHLFRRRLQRAGPNVRACRWQASCLVCHERRRGGHWSSRPQGHPRTGCGKSSSHRARRGCSCVPGRDDSMASQRLRLNSLQGSPLARQHWTRFRGRERGGLLQAEEDEDADTDTESEPIETAACRHRAQVAAAAAAAHAAYVSGARGTGAGGRGGRRGGSHGRTSAGRGHARSGGR